MKLKASHLFFLLLGILLLSNLGFVLKEGLESKSNRQNDDAYILKSEIVPPVCPKCPDVNVCPKCGGKPLPPCPPCGRCPKPAFKCKKVPDYSSVEIDGSLPRPILSDFSQFSSPSAM